MSRGKKGRERRKNLGNRAAAGPGSYGNFSELERADRFLNPEMYSQPWRSWQQSSQVVSDLPPEVLDRLKTTHPDLVRDLADGMAPDMLGKRAGAIAEALAGAGAPPGPWSFSRGTGSEGYGTQVVLPRPGEVPPAFRRQVTAPSLQSEGTWMTVGGMPELKLPASLRGKDMSDTIPVIISTLETRPEGGGEWLGRLNADIRTQSGAVWPEGANVWLDTRPSAEDEPKDRVIGPPPGDPGEILVGSRVAAPPMRTSWAAEDILNRHARLAALYRGNDRETVLYLMHLMDASYDASPEQAGRMHFPVQAEHHRTQDDGRLMAGLLSRQLREALTYQVTAPMVEMMRQSEQFTPGVTRLMEGEMPAVAGWAWLDAPWTIPVRDGNLPVRVVSWSKASVPGTIFGTPGAGLIDAVRLVFWVHLPDLISNGEFAPDDPRVADLHNNLGDLIPHHISLLPFRYRFLLKEQHEDEGLAMMALVHSLWTFLGMELSASRTVRPSRKGHVKNVLRSINQAAVHVITLRRVSYISANGSNGHRQVNRTCKWWVDDFYRHIDPYRDEDADGRPRRHEAEPAGRARALRPDEDDHDVCGVCLDRGQTVRITLVHGHRRGPEYLPWRTQAKSRTVRRLSR